MSLIAALREEARQPLRTIQWYLGAVHGLRVSVGAIADATHRVARQAQAALADIVERIRGSPVVHADETGWRQDGNNGYVWTFSTPIQRYFPCSSQGQALRWGRGKAVVDEVLGEEFAGVLVSDFYAAYHHYNGPKQRCWAHPCSSQGQVLLRDIHDLRTLYPDDDRLTRWADAVHELYVQAKTFTHLQDGQRRTGRLALAVDPTLKGDDTTAIVISVVYRGCAIPVAWRIMRANRPGAWMDPIVELLRELAPAVPQEMTVIVLCDRGLTSPKLWQQILAQSLPRRRPGAGIPT